MTFPTECTELLQWIDSQQTRMNSLIEKWANVNSGSGNISGLERMKNKLLHAFSPLKGQRCTLSLSSTPCILPSGDISLQENGDAILIRQRLKAPLRILLGGHMDTVFSKSSSFLSCKNLSDDRLNGPGVADMKGGLIIMLYALLALEKSPYAENIGWDVLITPDEETGSTASAPLWKQYAWQNHIALLFEPSLPDGSIVSERMGSSTYYILAKGVKSHAGRDFHSGKSAIAAIAEFITAAHALNTSLRTVNIGLVQGGEAANIVPEKSFCTINVRSNHGPDLTQAEHELTQIAAGISSRHGVSFELFLKSFRPPKLFSIADQNLFDRLQSCANFLKIDLKTASTGGVCDGNLTAAEGVPTLDTLGAIGGALHTEHEWIWLPGLTQRARLAAALLISLAATTPSSHFIAPKLHAYPEEINE